MSDNQNNSENNTPANENQGVKTDDNNGAGQTVDDAAKWKALSRKNENELEKARKEIERLKAAQMTDAEKAMEQAKEEGRKAALSEVGNRLAEAEIKAAAASAGRKVPEGFSDYLNLSAFVGDDGSPNSDAVTSFVNTLPEVNSSPRFPQNTGLGPQGGSAVPQLTRADMARMSPQEIVKARQDGRFDDLLNGSS
ncbi:hypothetical protein AB0I72_26755 [Nocardiopsis sp. NPDC049922]|uniref:hypothetical protein n=1 Tax=Nocardiopsis sp. NPDC049922 TaxID=3155157 RepID=UPI0033DEFA98